MHQDIENLLYAAKMEGSLTEKQRNLILSKSEQYGEDASEIEFLLEGIPLSKNEQNVTEKSSTITLNKQHCIRKCSVCGNILQTQMTICPACKNVVENLSVINSMERLLGLLKEVDNTTSNTGLLDDIVFRKKKTIIQNFPIPNTKTDIIDFIIALQPKVLNTDDRLAKSFFVKYQECINRAQLLFPDDIAIKPLFTEYKKIKNTTFYFEEKYQYVTTPFVWFGKGAILGAIIIVVFLIVFFII